MQLNVAQIKSLKDSGFYTKANHTAVKNSTKVTDNKFKHTIGGTIKITGTSAKELKNLSSENLSTSINDDGSINLLMAKTPKFNDINISKSKGETLGNNISLIDWLSSIENNQGYDIEYFSVNSSENGNKDNKGAKGTNSIAIGPKAKATANYTTALGYDAQAIGGWSTALGQDAKASGFGSTAAGTSSKAKGKNSVAIDPNSSDEGRTNTVSVGSKGNERTISNVANPIVGTDAVNLNYLNNRLSDVYKDIQVKDESRAGSASVITLGGILQATVPGKMS